MNSLDSNLETVPDYTETLYLETQAHRRASDILSGLRDITLGKVEIAKDSGSAQYRKDYDIGDLVTIQGNYDTSGIRRVTEFVEIEDENGYIGYPVVSDPYFPFLEVEKS
jgi:hypothetical protein